MPARTVAVMLIVLLAAGCRIERTERPPAADPGNLARAGIASTLAEFEAALAQHDARAAAAFFAPDGLLVMPGSGEHAGRGEIALGLESTLRGDSTMLRLTSEQIDVAAGVAWQSGTFHRDAGESGAPRGRFAIRWQRGPDATWRMHRLLLAPVTRDSTAVSVR